MYYKIIVIDEIMYEAKYLPLKDFLRITYLNSPKEFLLYIKELSKVSWVEIYYDRDSFRTLSSLISKVNLEELKILKLDLIDYVQRIEDIREVVVVSGKEKG